MADFFSFLSDTDDSAVDELISQVQDLCVLEQVSAINCSGFTDSELPSDLESRFRKLKSFPLSKPKSITFDSSSASQTKNELDQNSETRAEFDSRSDEDAAIFSPSKQYSEGEGRSNRKLGSNFVSSPVDSSSFSTEKGTVTPLKENSDRKRRLKKKSKCANYSFPSMSSSSSLKSDGSCSVPKSKVREKKPSVNSPLNSSNSWMSFPSPLRKLGSLWCSLKKSSQKKSKENSSREKNKDEFLSDLEFFSTKEQEKILKKAMIEEQKISREAEKIVKWAKQKSARMSFSAIEDEMSDSEIIK